MRINRAFGKRESMRNYGVEREGAKKFILIFEGTETEKIYFTSIIENIKKLELNAIFEFVTLVRSTGKEGHSNPQRILEMTKQYFHENPQYGISYEKIVDTICDNIFERINSVKTLPNAEQFNKLMLEEIQPEKSKRIEKVEDLSLVLEQIQKYLEEKFGIVEAVGEIKDLNETTVFVKGFDEICLIVDRDADSFIETQFDYVISECEINEYNFFITNPAFEFWLLLHYDLDSELDMEKLKVNKKTGKKTYTEIELKKKMGNYKKNRFNADELTCNLEKAIQQSEKFCTDTKLLKNEVGTNLKDLFEKMRKDTKCNQELSV